MGRAGQIFEMFAIFFVCNDKSAPRLIPQGEKALVVDEFAVTAWSIGSVFEIIHPAVQDVGLIGSVEGHGREAIVLAIEDQDPAWRPV